MKADFVPWHHCCLLGILQLLPISTPDLETSSTMNFSGVPRKILQNSDTLYVENGNLVPGMKKLEVCCWGWRTSMGHDQLLVWHSHEFTMRLRKRKSTRQRGKLWAFSPANEDLFRSKNCNSARTPRSPHFLYGHETLPSRFAASTQPWLAPYQPKSDLEALLFLVQNPGGL